jgi:two-component system sensor histidine kinase KdpD
LTGGEQVQIWTRRPRRLAESLALAQQFDGIPRRFEGPDLSSVVVDFVRESAITLVVGQPRRLRSPRLFRASLSDRLVCTVGSSP